MQTKTLFIPCKCQGEVLRVDTYEGERDYYLTVLRYSFPDIPLLKRFRYALDVLCGKGIETADLVITEEDFHELRKF